MSCSGRCHGTFNWTSIGVEGRLVSKCDKIAKMEEGAGCTGDAVAVGKADVSGWVGAARQ